MTTLRTVLVAVIASLLCLSGIAFAAVFGDTSSWASGGTTFASITPEGIATMANYRVTNGATFTTADPNPTRATLRAAGYFKVDTTANAVDLDFSNDADLEAADLGTTWRFVLAPGHATQALTVTNGGSGVVVTTLNTLGTTCEDTADIITCTAVALEAVTCVTVCAD